MSTRSPYQTDVSDEEWAFVAPYLTLLPEDVSPRKYPLPEVCNGVRSSVKSGAHWRLRPHDLLPWPLVYQQMRRWMAAGCLEAIVQDLRLLLRLLLRLAAERPEPPTAANWRPVPASWTHARSSRRRRAARGRATTDTNAERGRRSRRSLSPSTRWGISWRWWSRPRTNRSARRGRNWRRRCSK